MLTVKDNWKDVKVGDRIYVPPQYGKDGFKATVRSKGSQNSDGHVYSSWFIDNVTLKLDGTPRKSSAKVRRNVSLYAYFRFEIIDAETPEVSIPKTAGELTDAHIGMRFQFHGQPRIEGVFNGRREYVDTTIKIYVIDATDDDAAHWAKYGYYIDKVNKLTYLGGAPQDVDETVDTDAKLAAYFNQELDKAMGTAAGAHASARPNYGKTIVEILKTLTK